MDQLNFLFEGDKAYAVDPATKKVIASADSIEELEAKLATGACPGCGGVLAADGTCPQCGQAYPGGQPGVGGSAIPGPITPVAATHIETPNGLKGKILGKHAGVFEDEVTVRFENGRIVSLPISKETKFVSEEEEVANPVAHIESRLASTYDHDKVALERRMVDLKEIRREATNLINSGVSFADEQKLDGLVVTADLEQHEIHEALEAIADGSVTPYAPPTPQVYEQADVGHQSDGSWLDHTVQTMIDEAEGTDYGKLLDEGPELFTTELDSGALADQRSTTQMASSFIRQKTAGVQDAELRDEYEKKFIERVEQARRAELASRKEDTRKEAATKKDEYENLPDDCLFS